MSDTTAGIMPASPTLALGGQNDLSLTDGLLNLVVIETAEGLYRCEANIGNWNEKNGSTGYLYFDRQTLDFGKAWQVKIGAGSNATAIFDGRIMGLEAQFPTGRQPYLTVLAEDRFQDLRMTRRTRSFENVTDSDVINQIANDHGLSPDVQVNGPTYRILAQVNQSDLAFLRERARAIDAELWMEGSTLHAQARARRDGGTVTLTYPGSLREFAVLADLAHQRTSVSVHGWDVDSKATLRYEADDAVLGAELNGGVSGASIVRTALGARKETIAHTVPLSSAEVQSTAEATFKQLARQFVTGRGLVNPDSKLRVGSYVELKGIGPLFQGRYYLVAVKHLFDRSRGLRTEITVERPGLGKTQ